MSAVATAAAAGGPLILVVDDFPDGRDLVVDTLTHAGFRVAEAADGADALRKVADLAPAVVLMDLALPGIDGWEAIRLLKTDPRTASIPILALTANALRGTEGRARAAGCDAFLMKPYSPRVLVEQVKLLVAGRS